MYEFLAANYFPRVVFGPAYLASKKKKMCDDQIEILGYKENERGVRSSLKYCQQI